MSDLNLNGDVALTVIVQNGELREIKQFKTIDDYRQYVHVEIELEIERDMQNQDPCIIEE